MYYLLSYDNELLFEGGRKMEVECVFRGFDHKYDIVAKIWSKSSIFKNLFFNDIGTQGEDYCHLNFKYPMRRFKMENYTKNKNYYTANPKKFIKLLEQSVIGMDYPSLKGYVLCSDSNPLFKVIRPKNINRLYDPPYVIDA